MGIKGNVLAAKMVFDGKNDVIGLSRIVITGTKEIDGIKRLMFGGVVLSDVKIEGTNQWMCMDGMVCLVPTKISQVRDGLEGYRIDQLMTSLSLITDEDLRRSEDESNL